jgi:hypothetical protein
MCLVSACLTSSISLPISSAAPCVSRRSIIYSSCSVPILSLFAPSRSLSSVHVHLRTDSLPVRSRPSVPRRVPVPGFLRSSLRQSTLLIRSAFSSSYLEPNRDHFLLPLTRIFTTKQAVPAKAVPSLWPLGRAAYAHFVYLPETRERGRMRDALFISDLFDARSKGPIKKRACKRQDKRLHSGHIRSSDSPDSGVKD